MKFRILNTALAGFILSVSSFANAALIIHTTDFIDDTSRSQLNGFDNIPNDGTYYSGGSGPYIEDGIAVEQINGDAGNTIWVTLSTYSWYPDGGDNGYTKISLSSGLDFNEVGFYIGSGANVSQITNYFELWDDGALFYAGSITSVPQWHYIGFEGGGFDTILIRDGDIGSSFYDGTRNTLVVDKIETKNLINDVPEPSTLAIFALGVIGLASRRFNK